MSCRQVRLKPKASIIMAAAFLMPPLLTAAPAVCTGAVTVRVTEDRQAVPALPAPADVEAEIREASRQPGILVKVAGSSTQGRTIPMVVIPPRHPGDLPPVRVLVIAGQHGNEPAGISAALRIIRAASQGADPASLLSTASSLDNLKDVLLLVIPVVNPDGLQEGIRANASGKDLNRDWETRGQPETQAVRSVVNSWAPHLILDLHQWKSGDAGKGGWWVEYLDRKSLPVQNQIQQSAAHFVAQAAEGYGKVQVVASGQQAPGSLAHRAFSRRGYPTLLVEAAVHATPELQAQFLVDVTLLAADHAGAIVKEIPAFPLEAVQKFQYSKEFRQWMAQAEKTPVQAASSSVGPGIAGVWLAMALWGYLVFIRAGTINTGQGSAKDKTRPVYAGKPGISRLVALEPMRLPSGRRVFHANPPRKSEKRKRIEPVYTPGPASLPPRILEIRWFYDNNSDEPAGQTGSEVFSGTGR